MVFVQTRVPKRNDMGIVKTKKFLLVSSFLLYGCLFVYCSNLKTYHWQKEGAYYNGYLLEFFAKIKEIKADEPEGYEVNTIYDVANEYNLKINADELPHIIVVMDEAFSDLNVINEVSTNETVTPYISSLKEDTVYGYALSSVFGGNTANSEFEFLTGNSMAWLPYNTIPYQQYVNASSYSIVSYLKSSYDYNCIAMHPYDSSGWNRTKVYSYFGFDEWMFQESFPQEKIFRDYISDEEMFEQMIHVYEQNNDNPLFLFGVTMQNHGGYKYSGDNYEQIISLTDYADTYSAAEQYLTCIHETDKAVELMVEHFKSVDDEVIIVFFGDHLPNLDNGFYETLNEGSFDTIDEQQKKYMVPFFIWANYDIEEQYIGCTSLNYLSNYMYEAAGMPLPSYNQFLKDVQEVIPAMNANGYFSVANKCFVTYDQAESTEKEMLDLYEQVQYNNLFDVENRNEVLFPVVD